MHKERSGWNRITVDRDVGQREGEIVTRPLTFSGKHLFVNADIGKGTLCAEVLDADGKVLPGYSAAESTVVTGDRNKARIEWKNRRDLSALAGRTVRFRFVLKAAAVNEGDFYSFWVSSSARGESGGYLGGGGRGYAGNRDL